MSLASLNKDNAVGTAGDEQLSAKYDCGCENFSRTEDFAAIKFCNNSEHRMKDCGCYNLGGNPEKCIWHEGIRAAIIILSIKVAALLFMAAVYLSVAPK